MIVLDASVLAPVVADVGSDGRRFRRRLRGEAAVAPDLLRIEVVSVLRRQVLHGDLSPQRADAAVEDLRALPITVHPTAPLLGRVWELRANVTGYDACYVALAEATGLPLLTADRRLAGAPGIRCAVEVI